MIFRNIYFYTIILTLVCCAHPVSPTGGDKDTKAPVLKRSNIANYSTQIKPNKITFYFDENIKTNNPKEIIVVSPLFNEKNKITQTQKSITIHFSEELKENTTYTIQLNNAISDLNEGNIGTYKPFIFTTGNSIDSQIIHGSIESITQSKSSKYRLFCYAETNPTLQYTALINNGKFTVLGLDSNLKTLLVFDDANNNLKPDSTEDIAYSQNIKPSVDTTYMKVYNRKRFALNINIDGSTAIIGGIPGPLLHQISNNTPLCSIYKDSLITTPENIPLINSQCNPSNFIIQNTPTKIKIKPNYYIDPLYTDSNHIRIVFNKNIKSIDFDKIKFTLPKDSTRSYSPNITAGTNYITIETSTLPETFNLYLPSNSITFLSQELILNNVINEVITLKNKDAILEFNNAENKTRHIALLCNQQMEYISVPSHSSKTLFVPHGTYNGHYFADDNNDFLLTAPIIPNISGEAYYFLKNLPASSKLTNVTVLK